MNNYQTLSDRPADHRHFLRPVDNYNRALVANVHPLDWDNPEPASIYDLVVIGAGTAGLVVAAGAAGLRLGLKVALVEKHLMGGDCLNVGCVPSKCVIRSSRAIADLRNAPQLGIYSSGDAGDIDINFGAVMERMRKIRSEISTHDSADRFKGLGVDVFFGAAQFINDRQIAIETPQGQVQLSFKKAVIATGAKAAIPAIQGLEDAGYLTNENVFSLSDRPQRLAIIGGGAIGCELAQAFQRLGSTVTLFHKNDRLLDREDADASAILRQEFEQEGINLALGANIAAIAKTASGKTITYYQSLENTSENNNDRATQTLEVDQILIAAGRSPNVEGLNLEAAHVRYDLQRGVLVDDYLQTSNPRIFAAGDICMDWKFTHAADAAARIVIKNALFSPFGLGKSKLSNLVMPWVTYTDPEVAHVGIYAQAAQALGMETQEIKIPLATVDRAIYDGETTGFVKILHQRGRDRILGATIVARHAGEMISEITLAIATKQGLNQLSSIIHAYPTQADAIKKAADAYRKTLLTPRTQALLKFLTRFS